MKVLLLPTNQVESNGMQVTSVHSHMGRKGVGQRGSGFTCILFRGW